MGNSSSAEKRIGAEFVHRALLVAVIITFLVSGNKYLLSQEYLYLVEAPCDSTTQTCFERDCDLEECPPNDLAQYRTFEVPASLFPSCSDNSCLNICSNAQLCSEIQCSVDDGDTCTSPGTEVPTLL